MPKYRCTWHETQFVDLGTGSLVKVEPGDVIDVPAGHEDLLTQMDGKKFTHADAAPKKKDD